MRIGRGKATKLELELVSPHDTPPPGYKDNLDGNGAMVWFYYSVDGQSTIIIRRKIRCNLVSR